MQDENSKKDNSPAEEPEFVEEENGSGSELDDSVVAEENLTGQVKALREKLKKCEAEKLEYLAGWQRAKADLVNARKQDEKDKTDFAKFANEKLLVEIVPVFESYELAKSHKESWESVDKNWRNGIEQIFSKLKSVLEKHSLLEIDPVGQEYDPNTQDAVGLVDVSDKKQDNKVVAVFSKGYALNGKIIKAPKVKVGQYKEK